MKSVWKITEIFCHSYFTCVMYACLPLTSQIKMVRGTSSQFALCGKVPFFPKFRGNSSQFAPRGEVQIFPSNQPIAAVYLHGMVPDFAKNFVKPGLWLDQVQIPRSTSRSTASLLHFFSGDLTIFRQSKKITQK